MSLVTFRCPVCNFSIPVSADVANKRDKDGRPTFAITCSHKNRSTAKPSKMEKVA